MSVLGLLEVIAPQYVREIEPKRIQKAISVAEEYRPKCLSDDRQEMAVAYYTAYLLAQSIESEKNPFGITSEREGDISHSFSAQQANSAKFYAKWQEFNVVCARFGDGGGSITVGLNYEGY